MERTYFYIRWLDVPFSFSLHTKHWELLVQFFYQNAPDDGTYTTENTRREPIVVAEDPDRTSRI